MTIKCTVCSKENPDTQEFCTLCGTPLKQDRFSKSEPLHETPEPAKELSPEDVDAMLASEAEILSAASKAGIVMPGDARQDTTDAANAEAADEAMPVVGEPVKWPSEPISLPSKPALTPPAPTRIPFAELDALLPPEPALTPPSEAEKWAASAPAVVPFETLPPEAADLPSEAEKWAASTPAVAPFESSSPEAAKQVVSKPVAAPVEPPPTEPRPVAQPAPQPWPAAPASTVSALPPPRTLPEPKASSRRFSPRCIGFGCIGVLVFFLVIVPAIYFFGLRVPIQQSLIGQIKNAVTKTFVVPIYSGSEQMVTVPQQKANTLAEPLWTGLRGVQNAQITFHQDEFVLQANWLFLPLEARADLRVDNEGNLMAKSLRLNWAANLLFSSATLSDAITGYVNEEILRPKNRTLLGLQLTEGDLFIAYKER